LRANPPEMKGAASRPDCFAGNTEPGMGLLSAVCPGLC
jgi:hypothetical protein